MLCSGMIEYKGYKRYFMLIKKDNNKDIKLGLNQNMYIIMIFN